MSQVHSTLVLYLKSLLTEYKFSRCFFPSLKLHSLWQAINGHCDTLVTQKECGNIVSRLRDLSSVRRTTNERDAQTEFLSAKSLQPFRPEAVFWWWLVLFPWCVGGEVVPCTVMRRCTTSCDWLPGELK